MMAPTFEIAVRPAVLPAADAGHHRVVDGGVTERAGDAEPRDVIVRVHGGLEADDGVHLEQRHRRRRALEIDLLEDPGGQRVRVHLEPDLERRRRVHALLDDLVQAERVGPELLVAEGLEAEDLLALGDEGGCRVGWRRSRRRGGRRLVRGLGRRPASAGHRAACSTPREPTWPDRRLGVDARERRRDSEGSRCGLPFACDGRAHGPPGAANGTTRITSHSSKTRAAPSVPNGTSTLPTTDEGGSLPDRVSSRYCRLRAVGLIEQLGGFGSIEVSTKRHRTSETAATVLTLRF